MDKNLIGERFGNLVVVNLSTSKFMGQDIWFCRCDCGMKLSISANNLIAGKSTSCKACKNK